MIHRAPFGSMERFIGVLIEHFAGAFPLWLAPEQVRVCTVSEKSEDYGRYVEQQFRAAGIRVNGDFRSEKLGAKIRDSQLEKIPYTAVVGPTDAEAGSVSIRDRIDGSQTTLDVKAATDKLTAEIENREVRQVASSAPPKSDDGRATNQY